MIQKVVEIMEYEDSLVKANQHAESRIRIMHVACFGIGQYRCSERRTCKPFNPILGETYEFVCPQFKYIGEQVSHHPPISAGHADSEHYTMSMQTHTKMGMSMKGLAATPIGLQHVRLKSTGEHFSISRPTSYVKNMVFGTMYIEQVGEMKVNNYKTGEVLLIEFKAEGWGGRNKQAIEGYLYESEEALQEKKNPIEKIWGTWTT